MRNLGNLILVLTMMSASTALASTVTLNFTGQVTSIETDGGIALPGGVSAGTPFSGTLRYDFSGNTVLPAIRIEDGVDMPLYYNARPFSLELSIAGYHSESISLNLGTWQGEYFTAALFDDFIYEGQLHDGLSLGFSGESGMYPPYFFSHNEIYVNFLDPTASAFDHPSLSEPLPDDWRIPLDVLNNITLTIRVAEFYGFDENHYPIMSNYFLINGQIDQITEIPLPAAGPLFAAGLALMTLVRRRAVRFGR